MKAARKAVLKFIVDDFIDDIKHKSRARCSLHTMARFFVYCFRTNSPAHDPISPGIAGLVTRNNGCVSYEVHFFLCLV